MPDITLPERASLLTHAAITAGDPHGGVAIHNAIIATSSIQGHASPAQITDLEAAKAGVAANAAAIAGIQVQGVRQEHNHTINQSLSTTWQDITGGTYDFTPIGATGETKITVILYSHAASNSSSAPARFSTRLEIDGAIQANSKVYNRFESGAVTSDEDFTRIYTVPTWGATEKTIAFRAAEMSGFPTKIGETYGYDQTTSSAQKTQTNLIIVEWLV